MIGGGGRRAGRLRVWGANRLRDLRLLECDLRDISKVEGGRRDSDRRGNMSLRALKL